VVEYDARLVGHDVAGNAALHHDGLHRLPVLTAIDDRLAARPFLHDREQPGEPVDRVASHPRSRAVGPHAGEPDLEPHRALAAGLQHRVGRFAEDGHIASQKIRPIIEQLAETVELGRDLFGRIEDVRDVDRRVVHRAGQLQHHREAALHVGCTEPPQRVAVDAGAVVAVDRHSVGVAGEHEARRTPEIGTGHQVVADAVERQPRNRQQLLLDPIRDRLLVLADRRDVDELGGELEQVGHPTLTP
jgi:hypothetical protein